MNYTANEYAAAIAADMGHIPHTARTLEVLDLHCAAMATDEWEQADAIKDAAWKMYRAQCPTDNDFPSVYNNWKKPVPKAPYPAFASSLISYEETGYAGMGSPE